MIKILVVFGTRPEAIKMCPLILELKKHSDFDNYICVTGQHKEMLDSVLTVFDVIPDKNLGVMQESQTLTMITQAVLSGIEQILDEQKPNLVLVHGDTTTAYAVSLACFYKKIPIGHVESGLRTNDVFIPFPEEFNRRSIDMISDLLFAPTEYNKRILVKEGIPEKKVFVTGNTVIDAMKTTIIPGFSDENIMWASDSKLILFTAHRRESLGAPMRQMFSAIKRIVREYPDVKIIYPVHPNPSIRKEAMTYMGGDERIRLIDALDVITFHNYIAKSFLILTDSGGIQEEAPSLNVPVIVMRNTTERVEGVETGALKLVGTDEGKIYDSVKHLLTDSAEYDKMRCAANPYGNGDSAKKIVEVIRNYAQSVNCSSCI